MSGHDSMSARLDKLSPERRALIEKRLRVSTNRVSGRHLETIARRGTGDPVPLSYSQRRLWFLDQLKPGNSIFTLARALRVERALDIQILERAVNLVVERHEILRTTFSAGDREPEQVVASRYHIPIDVQDLRSISASERETFAYKLASEHAGRHFNLTTGPLLRVSLFRLAEADSLVVIAMHHIISDVWSMRLFVNELGEVYESLSAGRPARLLELPIQYGDFAAWQRRSMENDALEGHFQFWSRELEGAPELRLPLDHARPAEQSYRGEQILFALDPAVTGRLSEIGQRLGATLFMVLLGGFYAVMARYSGQEDIVVGSAVAGRNNVELEGVIGFFVNSLVLRADVSGNPTFSDLVVGIREMALDAYAHQDLPFEVLVERLRPRRDLSRHPIFQVTFQLITLPGTGRAEASQPTEIPRPFSGFDLVFDLWGDGGGISGRMDYNTDLFEQSTAERLLRHYQNLLAGAAENPALRLSELPLLDDAERARAMVDWNATAANHPAGLFLHELVEAQAARTPDAIAVLSGKQSLTFAELNRKADSLAAYLGSLGISPDMRIGISVPRSADLVVALLGVLKAGGAYVPLDSSYPPQRLASMLEDSGATVLLTSNSKASQFGRHNALEVSIDEALTFKGNFVSQKYKCPVDRNLAYVLYTSGSTGTPKGVMIEHRAIVNHMLWMQSRFPIGLGDRVLQRTPVSFDASVWEFYAPLMTGATLVVPPVPRHFDHMELASTIRDERITILQLVPSLLRLLVENDLLKDCRWLKRVFSGGEALTGELRDRFFRVLPQVELCNLYGPTEACIDATYYVPTAQDTSRNVSIGQPISNMQAYILDDHMNIVPVGIEGELYLAGVGLARGYLNQPALTDSLFIPSPFGEASGIRLYKTGDRCRYLASGNIEYLGRVDTQTKIRGIRIELEEVEQVLLEHPEVRVCAAAVQRYATDEARLVAYVVAAQPVLDQEALASELKTFLKERLPEPCVPSVFLFLENLPSLPNGKINRVELQSLGPAFEDRTTSHVAPRTAMERQLAEICCKLLQLEQIGVNDNLFEVGAHSLLATQIISRIRAQFSAEVEIRHFFDSPSIAELAAIVDRLQKSQKIGVGVIQPLDREKYRRRLTTAGANATQRE